jgi:hypothetical protein
MSVAARITITLAAILTSTVIYWAFCNYPAVAYDLRIRNHPLQTTCSSIATGSDIPSAIESLNRFAPPFDQRLYEDRIVIYGFRNMCTIHFDPLTKRVLGTESRLTDEYGE